MSLRTSISWTAGAIALSAAACSPVDRTFTSSSTTTSTGSTTATGGGASTGGSTTTTTTTMCAPESDAALCTMLGATCDMATGKDNCGTSRTVSCGTCTGADVCDSNACKPAVCASLVFGTGTAIATVNEAGVQDIVSAVTPDGASILLKHGASANTCGSYTPIIADATPPSMNYVLTTITPPAGMDLVNEEYATLASNGLEIVAATTLHTGFLSSTRSAQGKADFGAPSGATFVNITATGKQTFSNPYLAPGQLSFYYVVSNDANATNNGIYQATRATSTAPFSAGVLMPAPVQDYQYVTAVSVDEMTLFLQTTMFTMVALSRNSQSQPFVNPNAPAAAPILPGFRTRPLETCTTLVGTCFPVGVAGGCANERICIFPAM